MHSRIGIAQWHVVAYQMGAQIPGMKSGVYQHNGSLTVRDLARKVSAHYDAKVNRTRPVLISPRGPLPITGYSRTVLDH